MKNSYEEMLKECNQQLSFVKVEFERDWDTLHKWMHEDHVIPYWNLNFTKEKFAVHLKKALADTHQTLYLGCLDSIPMSYWESYWVKGDIIEDYYESEEGDQGIHLLIGDPDYLGKGLALPFLRAMVKFQLLTSTTNKVMAEPDIRNAKMIHLFEKCGFTPIKEIELPDKNALLMSCTRENFERKWNYGEATIYL